MGIQYEKVKKDNISTNRPIPVKQGRVRGYKNIFMVGLMYGQMHISRNKSEKIDGIYCFRFFQQFNLLSFVCHTFYTISIFGTLGAN